MAEYGERPWLSAYLPYAGSLYADTCDRILTTFVWPFVETCIDNQIVTCWFFVRYSDGGPHVRLRLLPSPGVPGSTLQGRFDDYVRRHLSLGRAAVRGVRWATYDPEYERYGGRPAMRVVEESFRESSEHAIAELGAIGACERSVRLGRGLATTLVVAHQLFRTKIAVARFAERYRSTPNGASQERAERRRKAFDSAFAPQASVLTSQINELWRWLEVGEALTPSLDRYRGAIAVLRSRLADLYYAGELGANGRRAISLDAALAMIGPSVIHMMSNRLGVTNDEEAYLAFAIANALTTDAAVCEQ